MIIGWLDTWGKVIWTGSRGVGGAGEQGAASGGVVDVACNGEAAGESMVGLIGEKWTGERGSARWMSRGKSARIGGIGLVLGLEIGAGEEIGISAGCSVSNGNGGVCVTDDVGIKGWTTGGEKLTVGREKAADSAVLLAGSDEEAFSFAGNEASSKTTCLER